MTCCLPIILLNVLRTFFINSASLFHLITHFCPLKTGEDYILEVNGTSSGLSPARAAEDNRHIADLVLQKMNNLFANPPLGLPGSISHGWTLVWEDEFKLPFINSGNWSFDLGDSGWGNNELQVYTKSNASVDVLKEHLVIEAKFEDKKFTSSRINSKGKRSFVFGSGRIRVEARMKRNLQSQRPPKFHLHFLFMCSSIRQWHLASILDARGYH